MLGFWTVKSNCSRTNMFTDITILCADNKHVTSHKLILGVTSQYFQDILYPPISSSLDSETVRIRDESLIFAFVIGWVMSKPMPLGCTALCRPMRGLVSLSKLSTAQLRPHPYWALGYIKCNLPSWIDQSLLHYA